MKLRHIRSGTPCYHKALEEWCHYLEGSPHQIEILSDHKNLEIFKEACKLSCRQAHWALYLTRFDFKITHVLGKSAGKPDALSRRPDHNPGDNDNEDAVLLPTSLFTRSTRTYSLDLPTSDIVQRIKASQAVDQSVIDVLRVIQANKASPAQTSLCEHWSIRDGLILYSERIYVPHDLDLQHDLIAFTHDHSAAGHPERLKTLDLMQRFSLLSGGKACVVSSSIM
jgi:RNase H-like domain found in reverse transcriptase